MRRFHCLLAPLAIAALLPLAWPGSAAADLWPPPWAHKRKHRTAAKTAPKPDAAAASDEAPSTIIFPADPAAAPVASAAATPTRVPSRVLDGGPAAAPAAVSAKKAAPPKDAAVKAAAAGDDHAPAALPRAVKSSAPFQVAGYRSALFGMTREQVMAAMARDFRVPAGKVQSTINPKDGTTVLTARLDRLKPGPGPATLTYILGSGSRRLVRVGVTWTQPGEPTREERIALVNNGVELMNYFLGLTWAQGATHKAVPVGPNALALFVGQDPDGAAVEVDVRGVSYQSQQNGQTATSPPAKGPAALTLTYIQDVAHPDIERLPEVAF